MKYVVHAKVKIEQYWGSDTDLFVGISFLDGPLEGITGELRIDVRSDIAEIKNRLGLAAKEG